MPSFSKLWRIGSTLTLMRMAALLLFLSPALCAQTWKDYYGAGLRAAQVKNYSNAEKLLVRAAEEAQKFGDSDSRLGTTLNTLGLVYRDDGKASEAETLFRRALSIIEKNYSADSVDVANIEFNLANSLYDQNRFAAAIETYEKSLPIFERWFGAEGAKTAHVQNDLGDCYRSLGKYPEAEKYLRRAASLRESSSGIDSPDLAQTMNSLGLTFTAEAKYKEAESAYKMALSIREASLGLQSDLVRATLENYAGMLQKANRPAESARLMTLAEAIRDTSGNKR